MKSCLDCGCRLWSSVRVRCPVCSLERAKKRKREREHARRVKARAAGRCPHCGEKLEVSS